MDRALETCVSFRFTKILSFCGIRVVVVEKLIFVVEKRLAYEKISIFDKE